MKTKDEMAARAMWNAMTRAAKHLDAGDAPAALRCLQRGTRTAQLWIEGTHPDFRTKTVEGLRLAKAAGRVLRRRPSALVTR